MSAPMASASSGSIGHQPVAYTTTPAMSAATEPRTSPTTCRSAARTFRLSPARLRRNATSPFTASPASATPITASPTTGRGASRRSTAWTESQLTTASISRPLISAATISARANP